MKKWLLSLVIPFLYKPEGIDEQKLKDWLFASYANDGFKHYYTMRKRQLVNLMLIEDDPVKRAEARGRLNELKALSANISDEKKRRGEVRK